LDERIVIGRPGGCPDADTTRRHAT
jgi:hypothetical protein